MLLLDGDTGVRLFLYLYESDCLVDAGEYDLLNEGVGNCDL